MTRYQRWPTQTREYLFQRINFTKLSDNPIFPDQFPKYGSEIHQSVFSKLKKAGTQKIGVSQTKQSTNHFIFYQEATQYWAKAVVGLPFYAKNDVVGAPAHGRYIYFENSDLAHVVCAILNSNLFYLYFIAFGDCFHLSQTLALGFPISPTSLTDKKLVELNQQLMTDLRANAETKTINTKDGDRITYAEFYASQSKDLIDLIDQALAKYYGFTDKELDFIINYDIKYRMGDDLFEEEEEA